jgi:hypothetical protein
VATPARLGGDCPLGEYIRCQRELQEREGHVAFGSLRCGCSRALTKPTGHDLVLHGRREQAAARPVPRALVLEHHLAEPREGIADMAASLIGRRRRPRIDVRQGAVGKLRTLLRVSGGIPA